MEKTVVELFAGVGGFRVGLNNIANINPDGSADESKGEWDFVWANQWEPSTKAQPAYDCYVTRFGKEHTSNEDINLVKKEHIPSHTLLVGGFPCQDYSVARTKSNEQGIEGKKGVLFWDISETLRVKNPPFVLLENVDRLLKAPARQRGRDFGIMLRTFYDYGYNVEWRVINAADYGARQRRRRVYIFAWKQDTSYNESMKRFTNKEIIYQKGLFAKGFRIKQSKEAEFNVVSLKKTIYNDTVDMTESFKTAFFNTGCMTDGEVLTVETSPLGKKPIPLKSTLQRQVSEGFYLSNEQKEKFSYLKGAKRIPRRRPDGSEYIYSEGSIAYPEDLEKPSRTMLTSEGTTNRSTHVVADLDTGEKRLITPIEAERLQHFPDDWTNTGMTTRQRYFMMGNALVTMVVSDLEPILSSIVEKE